MTTRPRPFVPVPPNQLGGRTATPTPVYDGLVAETGDPHRHIDRVAAHLAAADARVATVARQDPVLASTRGSAPVDTPVEVAS